MIAEISAVVGILKALNDGIATVKESGDHLSGLARHVDDTEQVYAGSQAQAREG
jgi:hypothetical protein